MKKLKELFLLPIFFIPLLFVFSVPVFAEEATADGAGHSTGLTFLLLAILLLTAKFGGIIEKFGQPAVLGEIAGGVILSFLAFMGFGMIGDMRHSETLRFIAELGAVILLFQIGLETNINKMAKVGVSALLVAIVGVVAPFILGTFVVGPLLFPDLDFVSHLFIGASLVATSVGITAYIFQEMKVSTQRFSQVVLGAAVIDDVLGLLVLAVVTALASGKSVDPMFITMLSVKAFGFLAGAVILGNIFAKTFSKIFSAINTGLGMKLALALVFALVYAYAATLVGLAPIVGAFAAGLILDAVHFNSFDLPAIAKDLVKLKGFDKQEKEKIDHLLNKHKHGHIEDLVTNIGLFLVPIFFVFTGLQIDFASLLNPQVYFSAFIVSIVAIAGKVVAGLATSGALKEKLLVGTAMVPRGEVGLIFASVGKSMGAINGELFSVIILVIMTTTFLAPPAIKFLLKTYSVEDQEIKKAPAVSSAFHFAPAVKKPLLSRLLRIGQK
jgi:Kef-type K+ transport system membrane component KefB